MKSEKYDTNSELLRLFLHSVPGIGNKTMFALDPVINELNGFELFKDSVDCFRDYLDERQFLSLCRQIRDGKEDFIRKTEFMSKENIRFFSIHSKDYPKRLKDLSDPPYGIYVLGKMIPPNAPSVAIIGARQCSEYGKYCAFEFGRRLSELGITIISGMARGVDGYAMRGALEGEGLVCGVLGCSVEYCYPKENRDLYQSLAEKGGLISEYSLGTQPESRLFPARNRIISGLADIVLVVEARSRSGTYITITQALEQGREVFAVPGRITDELSNGCNRLIQDGAGVATSAQDIIDTLKMMGWKFNDGSKRENNFIRTDVKENENGNATNDTERKDIIKEVTLQEHDERELAKTPEETILSVLDLTPKNIDTIMKLTEERFSFQEVYFILIHLQLKGKIVQIGTAYSILPH